MVVEAPTRSINAHEAEKLFDVEAIWINHSIYILQIILYLYIHKLQLLHIRSMLS